MVRGGQRDLAREALLLGASFPEDAVYQAAMPSGDLLVDQYLCSKLELRVREVGRTQNEERSL